MYCNNCGIKKWSMDHSELVDGRVYDYLSCDNCGNVVKILTADYEFELFGE